MSAAPARSAPVVQDVRWLPGSRLAALSLLALPVCIVPGWGFAAALAYTAFLALAAAWEARTLASLVPSVTRSFDARLLLGVSNRVTWRLHNARSQAVRVTLRDDWPASFEAAPDELAVTLPAYARRELSYDVVPSRRGRFAFGVLHLRVEGLARLGAVIASVDARADVRVYPNVRGPRRYELAAQLGSLHTVGVRHVRRVGSGGEFEQLREYVPGDSYREIDWKATAKRLRPVTRVHGQEQSQTVLVALDAGRMMATRMTDTDATGGVGPALTKLDHAIHAALLLAYVALRAGDRVGVVVFADDVFGFVPPGRGRVQYRRILEALYAVEASATHVDFRRLVEFVRVRVPRRALVVLFSDLLDESQAGPLAEHAQLLRAKHLPVCVSMNDPIAEAFARAPMAQAQEVYRRAAAVDLLMEREAIGARLRKSGVGLVEAPVGEMAIATVNRYLDIKSRHAL